MFGLPRIKEKKNKWKKKKGKNCLASKSSSWQESRTLIKKWEENDVPTKCLCVITVEPAPPEIPLPSTQGRPFAIRDWESPVSFVSFICLKNTIQKNYSLAQQACKDTSWELALQAQGIDSVWNLALCRRDGY